ncbi:MAG TPA: response regulator [Thermoanaerobaculales bacterium]|nr:response regulator [Thermoanaerobaculales bacterium]HPA81583.1 response regulator [Thermoanaerobaculales bacterium]HQL30107.1 response regulator [Thermoanaerobaculales bacterium]HQN94792.1 response regulator [Thermoanaerobaculales bacterium]HQP43170.1 response regulator [Thermoanaerobaculales bacterium]
MTAKETVLIVDDDVDLVESLRMFLERGGYAVRTAHDAETGLERVDGDRPDLILLDVMMPESTEGFQFIWRLRQRDEEYFRKVPVIMLTSVVERTGLRFYPASEGGSYPAGDPAPVQDFIDKSVEPDVLLERVRAALVAAWRKG